MPLTAALTLHASAANMGFLAATSTAPFLLFGLFAGVWVDRLRRQPILIIADIARFALLSLIPILALRDALTLVALYLIAFLVGILTLFFDVAYQSSLPVVVGRPYLVEGNGKLETTRFVSTGALTGRTLGAVFGLRPTLIIGAVGGLFAVVWVFCSPVRTRRELPALAGEEPRAA